MRSDEIKYKVGDKVVLRSDLIKGDEYGEYFFLSEMHKLRGKTVTIEEVRKGSLPSYRIEEYYHHFFTDEMFLDESEHKYLNL